jgi:hypothetical protein
MKFAAPPREQLLGVWCLSLPLTAVCAFTVGSVLFRVPFGLSLSLLIPILVVVFALLDLLAVWLAVNITLRPDAPASSKKGAWLAILVSGGSLLVMLFVITHSTPF